MTSRAINHYPPDRCIDMSLLASDYKGIVYLTQLALEHPKGLLWCSYY